MDVIELVTANPKDKCNDDGPCGRLLYAMAGVLPACVKRHDATGAMYVIIRTLNRDESLSLPFCPFCGVAVGTLKLPLIYEDWIAHAKSKAVT